ncbi:hypothetical protein C2845_PM10G18960 [Panicum miliaceum]|uniref:Uncharacterized protein n=1 Tax=Panicum miliaceum TaxID=4540 RepID=A0A3L6PGY6_PANMI|nr:hypothetical protein C2845_PM10G18960 [Panicum miliaceum]
MNFDLNISNQLLQHSKNSTATSWSLPPPGSLTAGLKLAGAPEIPRSPSRAAARASEVLLDGVGVDLLHYARHLVVGGRMAHALEQCRQLRPRDPIVCGTHAPSRPLSPLALVLPAPKMTTAPFSATGTTACCPPRRRTARTRGRRACCRRPRAAAAEQGEQWERGLR